MNRGFEVLQAVTQTACLVQTMCNPAAVGGCRASLYNAATIESVRDLARFMREFEENHI